MIRQALYRVFIKICEIDFACLVTKHELRTGNIDLSLLACSLFADVCVRGSEKYMVRVIHVSCNSCFEMWNATLACFEHIVVRMVSVPLGHFHHEDGCARVGFREQHCYYPPCP